MSRPGFALPLAVIIADANFTITSYWPSSGVRKAELAIEVQE